MEGFLRAYYTNLNPNATEEEIMAFLESQGFGGMGNQPVEGGITGLQQNPMLLPQLGGDGGGAPPPPPGGGTGSISDFFDFIKSGGFIGSAARGIGNLVQNFNDRRKGRLDVTADMGIMPGRPQGALTTADDYGSGVDGGGRSMSEQSFSDSQSYGGGGSMDDMGADSFI